MKSAIYLLVLAFVGAMGGPVLRITSCYSVIGEVVPKHCPNSYNQSLVFNETAQGVSSNMFALKK